MTTSVGFKGLLFPCECVSSRPGGYSDPWAEITKNKLLPYGTKEETLNVFECLPIIIMTSFEPEQYRGTAIEADCDDFLLKPIDLDRLDAILDYFAPVKLAA